MNYLDGAYQDLAYSIMSLGYEKDTRNGKVKSCFYKTIRHKMSNGFPLLTTKKMYWNGIVTELLWFLKGDTHIKYLLDNDCNIWNDDCYGNYYKNWDCANKNSFTQREYLEDGTYGGSSRRFTKEEFIDKIKTDGEFAKRWGNLGPIYPKQWRNWSKNQYHNFGTGVNFNEFGIDQIANLTNELKTNPDSRRLLVNSYNVGEIQEMVLPPCHYSFQAYTREMSLLERVNYGVKELLLKSSYNVSTENIESICNDLNIPKRKLSLLVNMRSVDVGLGLPYNLASYGLLLEMLAKQVNMISDELIIVGADVHVYLDHFQQLKEQQLREPYELPKIHLRGEVNDLADYTHDDIILLNYKSHPPLKMPLLT